MNITPKDCLVIQENTEANISVRLSFLVVFIEGLSLTVADSGYSVRRGTNPYRKAMSCAGFFFLFF